MVPPGFGASSVFRWFERFASLILAVALSGCWSVLVAKVLLHVPLNSDEGFYLAASRGMVDGFLPYRDYLYTQMPLLPVLQAPLTFIFPTSLLGIRMISLFWTTLALGVLWWVAWSRLGVVRAALVLLFGFLCIDAMGNLSIGKAYALAHLLLLLTALPLFLRGAIWWRYVVLCAMGVLCVGTRLTMAPAVLVLWVWAGWTWRRELCWVRLFGIPVLAVLLLLGWAVLLDPLRFYYGVWLYHQQILLPRHGPGFWTSALMYLPGVWLLFGAALLLGRRRLMGENGALLLAAVAGLTVTALLAGTYTEYFTPCILPGILGAAAVLRESASRRTEFAVCSIALALLLIGFRVPTRSTCVEDSGAAALFLHEHTPEGAPVLASMPEVPLEAGRPLFGNLIMGKFAVTADYDPDTASMLRYLHYGELLALLGRREPVAVVFSRGNNANFNFSVPSLVRYSRSKHRELLELVLSGYDLAYSNDTYVVFLRAQRPHANPPAPLPDL